MSWEQEVVQRHWRDCGLGIVLRTLNEHVVGVEGFRFGANEARRQVEHG